MSASLRSPSVGSVVAPAFFSGTHHADRTFLGKNDLAVVDFVLLSAEGIDAKGGAMDAQWRLLFHLHLGENVAGRRIPSFKRNAGSLANQTAASIATDEIACPELGTIREFNGDAGIVLRETRYLKAAIDRHRQFPDPAGQNALDMLLPQRQPIIVPGRKIADIQTRDREARDLGYLPFREEPVDDAPLIENLERPRTQTAGTRTGKLLVRAAFDDGDVDACQGQFACQHQSRRPCPGNHDCMFPHPQTPMFRLFQCDLSGSRQTWPFASLRSNQPCADADFLCRRLFSL
ncbi:hypothetical protein ACVIGV_000777 [Rhizobium leguminosarum]